MAPETPATITVATYNVLADAHIRPERYPLVDGKRLEKATRYPCVVKRVASLDADVLCLQEVDDELFRKLKRALEERDYRGLHTKYAGKPDGLATFLRWPLWRTPRFQVLRFDDARVSSGRPSGRIAHVTSAGSHDRTLTVVNTHLKWDAPESPKDSRVGLVQAKELIARLASARGDRIVCGDFNATPDNAVLDAFRIAGYNDAYPASVATFNAGNGGARKIDYILHTRDIISMPLPPPEVTDATPLPSESEPSDHVPLLMCAMFTD